jgi:ABC-type multidrug transport system ATPase subunit
MSVSRLSQIQPERVPASPPPSVISAPYHARGIRARGLMKKFHAGIPGCLGTSRALDGVDIDIRSGELLGVSGPPGSGKSTLLLALGGILHVDAGTIQWIGESGGTIREPRAIEYLPPWRSAHALQSLRRAVAASPGILLIDDVLATLDPAARREARALIRELHCSHVTVVLASRGDSTTLSLCGRVATMKSGKVSNGV